VAHIIGMAFGTAYSNEILPDNWWETTTIKRILRGGISLLVYIGICQVFCNFVKFDNNKK